MEGLKDIQAFAKSPDEFIQSSQSDA